MDDQLDSISIKISYKVYFYFFLMLFSLLMITLSTIALVEVIKTHGGLLPIICLPFIIVADFMLFNSICGLVQVIYRKINNKPLLTINKSEVLLDNNVLLKVNDYFLYVSKYGQITVVLRSEDYKKWSYFGPWSMYKARSGKLTLMMSIVKNKKEVLEYLSKNIQRK